MRGMKTLFAIVLLAAACGGSSNTTPIDGPGSGSGTPDAPKVFMDAPVTVPATIMISGIASQQSISGPTPLAGVVVAAYKSSDPNTVVTMATTDNAGAYTLTITTNGMPVDGFLKATKTGNADTYLFQPAPLVADFTNASINMLDNNLYGLLSGGDTTKAFAALEVLDAAGNLVAGAAVTSNPASAKVGYSSGTSPLPNYMATATAADGRAFLQGVPTGTVSVSATKSGSTFKTHSVTSVANAFITTVITE